MGSSPAFRAIFASEPEATLGVSFARYMELAMYHPQVGYYTSDRRRVGRDRGADFFTATSFSPVFGELVVAAAANLLGQKELENYTFIEVGAEPGGGALRDVSHPFRDYRTVSLGGALEFSGRCIVFSNELFDAQPFHRAIFRDGAWRELGVRLAGDELQEVELPAASPELAAAFERFPREAPDGYLIDAPLRTVPLLERIVRQPWSGLFLAFDYGRSWRVLAEEYPEGTGRTYSRQVMGNNPLDRPGEIDLTCHICWDWLVDGLQQNGFGEALVESHEVFFTRRAASALEGIIAAEARTFSSRKQAVMQLLHPGHMGRKFQALHALRSAAPERSSAEFSLA
jgi:SAM-dependent MidA family methyltransferase